MNGENREKRLHGYFQQIHGIFVYLTAYFCLRQYLGIWHPSPGLLGLGLLVLAGVGILCLMKSGIRMICLSTGIGIGILLAIGIGIPELLRWIKAYGIWVSGKGDPEQIRMGFERLQMVWTALISFGLGQLLSRSRWLRRGAAAAVVLFLILACVLEVQIPKEGVLAGLFYVLWIYTGEVESSWKKKRSQSIERYMFGLLPFFLGFFLVLMVWPTPQKPYSWKTVKKLYNHVTEWVQEMTDPIGIGEGDGFAVSMTGFSEDESLSGEVKESRRKAMEVEVPSERGGNFYLAGIYSDTFTGREWKTTCEETERERLLDVLESGYSVSCYDREHRVDYIKNGTIKIHYENLKTRQPFLPEKTVKIQREDEGEGWGHGVSYEVNYLRVNRRADVYREYLKAQEKKEPGRDHREQGLSEAKMQEQQRNYMEEAAVRYQWPEEQIPDEEMWKTYREHIYQVYGRAPELSAETERWMEAHLDASTKTERLDQLEQLLASWTYTTTPGKLPVTVRSPESFLDYFLLDRQEGYCTYYATAFVLLARAQGIPARLVQGYCIPLEPGKTVTVYDSMAHAWPEAYLDGAGWIAFEPTPTFGGKGQDGWSTMQSYASSGKNENRDREESGLEQKQELQKQKLAEEETRVWLWILCGILIVTVLAAAIWLLLQYWKYRRFSEGERYREEYRRLTRVLYLFQCRREAGETLQEFSLRVKKILPEAEAVLEEYQDFLYGSRPAQEEKTQRMKGIRRQLWKLFCGKHGRNSFSLRTKIRNGHGQKAE